MQRARGRVEIGVGVDGLTHLHQSGCLKAMLPRNHQETPEVVLINTAGGITGGDQLSLNVRVDIDAKLTMCTQTAERIYKSSDGDGQFESCFQIGENAICHWLPQECIVFDDSRFTREMRVDLAEGATFMGLESVILGRLAMGEVVTSCSFKDRWSIYRNGNLVYTEAMRFDDPEALQSVARLQNNMAFSTLLYVADDAEDKLTFARSCLSFDTISAAASAWNGCLVVRFLAENSFYLREALKSFLTEFRQEDLPRVWQM